jgi:hypothetical protein
LVCFDAEILGRNQGAQQEAGRAFSGGPKAFEKYANGEVAPCSAMTRLLLHASKGPELFQKGTRVPR